MVKNIVLGAGGHARSLVSSLLKNNISIEFVIDINSDTQKEDDILGFPVKAWGKDWISRIENQNEFSAYLAIGNNEERKVIISLCQEFNIKTPSFKSLTAIIDPSAQIGNAVTIMENAFVGPLVKLGEGCLINTKAIIEHESHVGEFSQIGPGAVILGRCKVGNKNNIGAASILRNGCSITDHVTIGAGSVIVKNITEPGTYVGNPGRKI